MKRCYSKIAAVLVAFVLMWLPVSSASAQDNAIIITPVASYADPGEFFNVHIALDSGVTDVYLYIVSLKYDTNVVRFDTAWADPAWDTLSSSQFETFNAHIENEGGQSWYLDVRDLIFPNGSIDGYTEIATLQFEAVASGVTELYFDFTIIKNPLDQIVVEDVRNGMLYVCPIPVGNVDGSPDMGIDISDLVYLVDYMFTGGPAPVPTILAADMDCSLGVDISDLVYLVDYMFTGGPEPCDPCP